MDNDPIFNNLMNITAILSKCYGDCSYSDPSIPTFTPGSYENLKYAEVFLKGDTYDVYRIESTDIMQGKANTRIFSISSRNQVTLIDDPISIQLNIAEAGLNAYAGTYCPRYGEFMAMEFHKDEHLFEDLDGKEWYMQDKGTLDYKFTYVGFGPKSSVVFQRPGMANQAYVFRRGIVQASNLDESELNGIVYIIDAAKEIESDKKDMETIRECWHQAVAWINTLEERHYFHMPNSVS